MGPQIPGWEVPLPAAQELVVMQTPGAPSAVQGSLRAEYAGEIMENANKRRSLKGWVDAAFIVRVVPCWVR